MTINKRVFDGRSSGVVETKVVPNMKIYTVIALTFIVLGFSVADPAQSEISFENYNRIKDSEFFKVYLSGLSDGYEWANAHLAKERLPRLFCAPDNLALNTINYSQILSNYLSKPESTSRFKSTDPIGPIVLMALRDALPCP